MTTESHQLSLPRPCQYCGAAIPAARGGRTNQTTIKYCSRGCKAASRAGRRVKLTQARLCYYCGTVLDEAVHPNTKYCSLACATANKNHSRPRVPIRNTRRRVDGGAFLQRDELPNSIRRYYAFDEQTLRLHKGTNYSYRSASIRRTCRRCKRKDWVLVGSLRRSITQGIFLSAMCKPCYPTSPNAGRRIRHLLPREIPRRLWKAYDLKTQRVMRRNASAARDLCVRFTCLQCGKQRWVSATSIRNKIRNYHPTGMCNSCSVKARNAHARKLALKKRWRDSQGYIVIYRPGYPGAKRDGRMKEHRWVMSQMLGRVLFPWEDVHHKNGRRDDNRRTNLELWIGRRGQPRGVRFADHAAWVREQLMALNPTTAKQVLQAWQTFERLALLPLLPGMGARA